MSPIDDTSICATNAAQDKYKIRQEVLASIIEFIDSGEHLVKMNHSVDLGISKEGQPSVSSSVGVGVLGIDVINTTQDRAAEGRPREYEKKAVGYQTSTTRHPRRGGKARGQAEKRAARR